MRCVVPSVGLHECPGSHVHMKGLSIFTTCHFMELSVVMVRYIEVFLEHRMTGRRGHEHLRKAAVFATLKGGCESAVRLGKACPNGAQVTVKVVSSRLIQSRPPARIGTVFSFLFQNKVPQKVGRGSVPHCCW